MKITKGMLDEELRSRYAVGRLMGAVLASEGVARFLLKLGRRFALGASIKGLDCEERTVSSTHGGRDFRVRVYRPARWDGPLPAMLYIHGGGYLTGKPEEYHSVIKRLIEASPCVVVAPDYRKAFEAPYPAAFNDCTDTLLWLQDHAVELGARAETFIVAGHSAGGGLTAAVSAWATDTDAVPIAFQMPVYPMIDDRPTASNTDNDAPVWNSKANQLGWRTYLRGLTEIPAYAAPARATDFSRLPPTITFVGDLEPFRDETIAYVEALRAAGVPVEFELFAGAYHGFDLVSPNAGISRRAWDFLLTRYRDFVARYC